MNSKPPRSTWPPSGAITPAPRAISRTPPNFGLRRTTTPAPSDAVDLTGTEFRRAVVAITRAVADDLEDAEVADAQLTRPLIEAHVQSWVRDRLVDETPVGFATQRGLAEAVYDERFELGVLTPYIRDPRVESIDINGCNQVWITYSDGARVQGAPVAASDADLINMIQMWALHKSYTPREFSTASPLTNAALLPGERDASGVGVRLSAAMSVTDRPCVSIRCHRLVSVTLDDLMRLGTINRSLHSFLSAAVLARKNIIVTGGTSAGKTTMLRALCAAIEPGERLITLETDYELFLHKMPQRHSNVVAYQVRQANSEGAGAISLSQMIPDALRKNPDRIIVGEVRADEIIPMFEAMNTGHPGSMCTIHADGAEEIFNRVVMLWTRGVGGASTPASVIHLNTGSTIDFVVHLSVDRGTNRRFVAEVIEVLPPADSDLPTRNHIYLPSGPGGRAVPHVPPQCLDDLIEVGLDAAALDARAATWPPPGAGGGER